MDTKDYFTLAIALAGLGLGLYNTWKAGAKERTKLKLQIDPEVKPHSMPAFEGTVTNLSNFPVTISSILDR